MLNCCFHLTFKLIYMLCSRRDLSVAKETEMQEKEMKLMELQEMYETRLLAMKVTLLHTCKLISAKPGP